MTVAPAAGDLLRELAPQVLGALVRRHGDFPRCEDAVQEALLAAHEAWPRDGLPDSPRAWLTTVATRRVVDAVRADAARERRESAVAGQMRLFAPAADEPAPDDDSLVVLLLCCHPAVAAPSQLALTLRAVGGLTTAEIARGLLVPEATVAQRVSRAKATIRHAGARFALPDAAGLRARLDVVHQVLYLMFNEGYVASGGPALQRPELCTEALRLTRLLHDRLPSSSETAGLLALMLLVDSRRATRQAGDGTLVPLAEQDRSRWDHAAIARGAALAAAALRSGPVGPYQLQAAIAAVHAEAPSIDATEWGEVVGLYDVLERHWPNPVAALNRAVAVGMRDGPAAGLALVEDLAAGPLAGHHRLDAVRAHLLERAGDAGGAAAAYRAAAARADNVAEQRFLQRRAQQLGTAQALPRRDRVRQDGPVSDQGSRAAAVAALFDRVADVYDTGDVPWFTPIARGLVAELRPRPGERALDLGTGRGAVLWSLADAVGSEGRVTGLDVSNGMITATRLEVAGRGMQDRVDLVVGDATAPDPALGPVDIVAASLVLFFLPDPAAALRAWTALLAPGGRLGVSTFGPRSPAWARLDDVFTPYLPPHLLDARTSGTRGPFASDDGVEELLRSAGLVGVRTVNTTLTVHFDDVEQWRAWSSSHGQRAHWDAVPPGDRGRVLTEAGRRLDAARDQAGGFTLEQSVRYTLGRRPG